MGIMRTLMLAVVLIVFLAVVDAQYGGGGCDWSVCRYDRYLAQRCCSSSGTCCDFANGGGNYNGGGYNNNNKPGNCPPYNGRKKRSPRGRFPGNNNSNNGGSCIRDSDCFADFKCCYLQSGLLPGYQCTRPNYYG